MSRTLLACIGSKRLLAIVIAVFSFFFSYSQNAIITENAKTGNPSSEWDISGSGDASLQGFATDISVNKGSTIRFKIKSTSSAYTIDIYRLGYYNGLGARKIGPATVTASYPQTQPAPLEDATTGLVDCGNWNESANWAVPSTAVSGVYIAVLKRNDNGNKSHIIFVVRDDASTSKLFFQTSDATWQAYNVYGGNSLYVGSTSFPSGHAAKVSYNRPFVTRDGGGGGGAAEDWIFNAEYPMIRFLERNGYDLSYTTNVDAARSGNLILNHKVFLSVGHDEYWSAEQRNNVEAARNAGVHLAFFSGNEVYWKTRWENGTDASHTAYRTLVCYKEGSLGEAICGDKCDPTSTWTGLWRDGAAYPAGGGNKPENALSGQISWDNTIGAITVPAAYKNLRFWRNTTVASLGTGQTATMTAGTLGYEWDYEQYPDNYPGGRITMSNTTLNSKTHKLSLYKHSSGALVFGAGTVQWSWGLDDEHDRGNDAPSTAMQQATVNLLADMGVQPGALMAGLVAATASTDVTAPVCAITSPASGASLPVNTAVTISGTASDVGGVLVGVEVSVDGGTTWKLANGTTSWTYSWTPTTTGAASIRVRGFDDSGNIGVPGATGSGSNRSVTITGTATPSTVTIFQATDAPGSGKENDGSPVTLGVKFKSTVNGYITGIRYYKPVGATGIHTGALWNSAGTKIAEATFSGESASGWQQANFGTPVAITANSTYTASYFSPSGDFVSNTNYFTAAVVNNNLRALADGEDGENGLYVYGTPTTLPSNSYVSSNYWVDVAFATTPGPDNTPPTVLSVTPVSGATGVNATSAITATFNEPMNAATLTSTNVELRNSSNVLVAATISATSTQVTLTPNAALTYSAVYTATIKSGSTGVKDAAGNALAANYTWSFTVASGAIVPTLTILPSTSAPTTAKENDGSPLTVGVKFKSTTAGYITGIRYYKPVGATGIHTGALWNGTGTKLAEVTFTGESASGWQQAMFSGPVAITPNTTYTASYFTPSGDFVSTTDYFVSAVVNGSLRALADGEEDGNGVYVYGTPTSLPTSTYASANYWVDVVFTTTAGPDNTAPTVISVSPAAGATGISTTPAVTANFGEAMNTATLTTTNVELRNSANVLVPATISFTSTQVTLTPSSALTYSTVYTATIKGGSTGVKDVAGNAIAANYTWSFTVTAAPPPPAADGKGGPILVISAASNPFSRYPVEILRAEGLNGFLAKDISQVTATELNSYDVVILGEMPLTTAQATMFNTWVTAGGTLIAFRPATQLSTLLGITKGTTTLSDQYLLVNTASGPGKGIVSQTMQFHGAADIYTLSGATSLATLYSNATTATTSPAVTTRAVGSNGGVAIAFTYDLAKSIVYTRQGNPAWAGQKRDGTDGPIRSDDLFFGSPNWIDFNKIAIPQADEQQRLLVNIILQGSVHRKPMPRFWFLPRGLKAAIVMTGDDHGVNGTEGRFNQYMTLGPNTAQDVADWKAVRGTSYIYTNTPITNSVATSLQAQGFEIGLHFLTGWTDFTPTSFDQDLTAQLEVFHQQFPGLTGPVTNRTHGIAWSDWASCPKISVQKGIRLDANYYYWPSTWILDRPGLFTGSGMPMRFADTDGTLIDCYQLTTQMTDESGITLPAFCDKLLDRALGDEGYYGVFCANMHTDTANHTGSNRIIASALARQVPVISAKQMLTWLDGRNGSYFGTMTWSSNKLTFPITVLAGGYNMKAMVPLRSATGSVTSITRNGSALSFTVQTIKGMSYAFFDAPVGTSTYVATYTVDNTAPTVSNITAVPNSNGTALITWTTNEVADSKVDFGTASGTLSLNAADGDLVTSHSVTLTGLTAAATYFFRVTSKDAANNSVTSPTTSNSPLSFIMPTGACFVDQTSADFTLGSIGTGLAVEGDGDGSLTLKPTMAEDFNGTTVPAGWTNVPFNTGGTTTVAGGIISVSGSHVYTNSTYGPGSAIEFVATFTQSNYQNIGFTSDQAFSATPWVVIGQSGTDGSLYASSSNGDYVSLGAGLLGTSHRFRIVWNATSFDFYVDGSISPVASLSLTIASNMYVQISDYTDGDPLLSVDWLRVIPYAASGSFVSRVYNAGTQKAWNAVNYTSDVPAGTTLGVAVRTGNTAVPDGTWSAYTAATSGTVLGRTAQYIQYKADFATTDTKTTPALKDLSISCGTPTSAGPVMTLAPTSQTVCIGSPVLFTSAASGVPAPTVKWQIGTLFGLLWSDISGATSPTYTFTVASGDNGKMYRCIWTNSLGSVTSATVTLTTKTAPAAPTISVVNGCNSTLTAGSHTGTLLWSTGATTTSITVPTAGTYTLTQTVNGCASPVRSATAAPNNSSVPVPTVAVVNNCGSSVLTAGGYTGSLLWSNGATTPSITVATAGAYTVKQTISGCLGNAGTGTASPKEIPAKPTIGASASTALCPGSSVTLTSSAATGNVWSTGATTQSIVVSAAGNYTVTVTVNGCSSPVSDITAVTANPAPAGTISSPTGTVCQNANASVVFNATSGTAPYSVVINGTTYTNVANGSTILTNEVASGTSLWDNTVTPSVTAQNDGQPVEVGVKFRTSVSGVIKSLRFYKGSNTDGGTYTLKLYRNSDQAVLASVNFANATASGWQTVNLSTPISVTAGTTYLVSCYSASGYYAYDLNYFGSARTVGTLTGLADGTDGNNSVYGYGAGGGFPTNSYVASNYWVDVVFSAPSMPLSLTSITDAKGCTVSGNLGTVNLTITNCSARGEAPPATISLTGGATTKTPASTEKTSVAIDLKLELGQNRPNPFNGTTLIDMSIPKTGKVKLAVYDVNGRLIRVLLDEVKDAGTYTVTVKRESLGAGVYYYRLDTGGESKIRKMTAL